MICNTLQYNVYFMLHDLQYFARPIFMLKSEASNYFQYPPHYRQMVEIHTFDSDLNVV